MARRVSLADVAKQAGVSITTASRAINDSDHPVNPETRDRVLQAAERLGYSPSALARALVTKRSGIIGALVGDNSDPYFATIVHGMHRAAQEHDSIVLIFNTLRAPELELKSLSVLGAYGVDGIIIAGGALTHAGHPEAIERQIRRFLDGGTPVVALTEHTLDVPVVSIDNEKVAYDATRHMMDLGHWKIAYIGGPDHLLTSKIREQGFRQAMDEAGFEPEYLASADFSFEGGRQAISPLLSLDEPPTALIAATDITALGCLVGAKESGFQIPADLSVMGIDNIEATKYVTPSLSTVRIPMREMGRIAVNRIFTALTGVDIPKKTLLTHELVIRGTTGPPNKGRQ